MQKIWKVKELNDNSEIESSKLEKEISPVVLALLKNRGIKTAEEIKNFFEFNYDSLMEPSEINGMQEAVERIARAIKQKEKVAIFGDYDADGVTATAVIYETFLNLNYENVIFYIPDRQLEGYGMNEKAVEYLSEQNVKLIITVDCGITNAPEVEKARTLGMDVIVTDHHHVPENIPNAIAVINPHIENSGFAFQDLAGVGVAFKLAQAVLATLNPKALDQLKWMLDLVAIGTIADCVTILGENRILVKYGLVVLSKTRRAGLLEMFQVGRIVIDENNVPDTQKVAFQIAPRINAAGRMDHASVSYNLIIEKNRARAREMALEVEAKNQERQKVTAEIVREVKVIADNLFKNKKFILAENEHWPVGILGLIAGKIMDEYQKPVMILQKQEAEYVGSLRSIPEVNIVNALGECRDLVIRFGGHAQAAGVKLVKENMVAFSQRLEKIIERELAGKEIERLLPIDLEISVDDLNWDLVNAINCMEPFGAGNPEPVFLTREMTVIDHRMVGNGSKHLKLSLKGKTDSPKVFDSIGFSFGEKFPDLKVGDTLDVVYNLQQDEWNGNKKMQLRLIDLKISEK